MLKFYLSSYKILYSIFPYYSFSLHLVYRLLWKVFFIQNYIQYHVTPHHPPPPPHTPHPPPPPPHYLGFQIIVLFFADTVKKQQEMLDCIWKKTCQCYLSEIIVKLAVNDNFCAKYEGESICNQPIPFPMDQEGHGFRALFQYMFYTWKQNCTRIESFFNKILNVKHGLWCKGMLFI